MLVTSDADAWSREVQHRWLIASFSFPPPTYLYSQTWLVVFLFNSLLKVLILISLDLLTLNCAVPTATSRQPPVTSTAIKHSRGRLLCGQLRHTENILTTISTVQKTSTTRQWIDFYCERWRSSNPIFTHRPISKFYVYLIFPLKTSLRHVCLWEQILSSITSGNLFCSSLNF